MSQVVIVTGSTSGIGLGLARAFAQNQAQVVINGFGDSQDIENTRQELSEYGKEVIYHGADMTQPGQIADLISSTEQRFGRVDVLINNAGVQYVSPIEDFPIERWDQIIAINLSSAFHTIRTVVPGMKKQGWGRIINLASAHALVASPYKAAYVAAKHGIAGLTKTVALELAETGITCNAICPGYVKTPLVENQIADTAKARGISEEEVKRDVLLKAQPTRAFTRTEDLGALAIFLCSKAAQNITGTLLPMDGGWTAQ